MDNIKTFEKFFNRKKVRKEPKPSIYLGKVPDIDKTLYELLKEYDELIDRLPSIVKKSKLKESELTHDNISGIRGIVKAIKDLESSVDKIKNKK